MTHPDTPSQADRLDRLMSYLGSDPENTALLADALQLALEAQPEKAAALLAHLEKYGTQNAAVAAHGALLALHLLDFRQAASLGEAAIAGGLDTRALRFNTAYAQLYLGNTSRVNELLTEAGEHYEDCTPDYLVLKARALHHLERPEEAEKLLRLAIAHQPENADALGILALLLQEEGRDDEALTYAEQALAIAPRQMEALLARADSFFDREDMNAARDAYQTTLDAHPASGRAWSGLGQIAFGQFEFAEAEKLLKEAVLHMPNHIGTWHVLAWIYILQEQPGKAREILLKSYALDRNFGDTHGGLAVVDAMEGKEAEARTGIRKALRLAPDGMAARYAELLLLEKSGDKVAAQQLVDTVLSQPASEDGMLRRTLVEKKLLEMRGKPLKSPFKTH